MSTQTSLKVGWAIAFALAACGSEDGAGSNDAGMSADSTSGVNCAKEVRKDDFAPGMTKVGPAGYSVALTSAEPSPPARFSNIWKLLVRDPSGAPRSVSLAVTPWMPDHNHGSPTKSVVKAAASPGEYQVDDISLWMPGLWNVKIHIEDGSISDDLAFSFCVEE